MKDIDTERLDVLLEDEDNESIIQLDNYKIKQIKNDIFQKLHFKPNITKEFLKKLKEYRFVDDLKDIRYGNYIRWINMKNLDDLKLTNGAIVCDTKIMNDSVIITCKNMMNRIFCIKMDECLIFQKINDNEKFLLSVMDHLHTK
jgi:hypothetical protein